MSRRAYTRECWSKRKCYLKESCRLREVCKELMFRVLLHELGLLLLLLLLRLLLHLLLQGILYYLIFVLLKGLGQNLIWCLSMTIKTSFQGHPSWKLRSEIELNSRGFENTSFFIFIL